MKKGNEANVHIGTNCVHQKYENNLNLNKPTSYITPLTSPNAITLIALIITIIVMLILVAVTMAITGGLFSKARKASDDTENATSGEIALADGSILDYYLNGGTKGSLNSPENIQVGDVVNYDCITGVDSSLLTYTSTKNGSRTQIFTVTENPEWVVLEIRANGEILITPRNPVQSLILEFKEGYENGVQELNNIAAMYGHGKGAISARSITLDDINRINRYTPPQSTQYTISNQNGEIYCGENLMSFYHYMGYPPGRIASDYFYYYNNGWKQLSNGESVNISDTFYAYSFGTTEWGTILATGFYWIATRTGSCNNK